MKVSKQSIAIAMLAVGLITTAGAGITAASSGEGFGFKFHRGGHAEVTSSLLGITVDEFDERIANGENPRDMLEAAGITKEDIKSAREARMQEHLAQAVADGKLTQEEADAIIAKKAVHKAKHEAIRTAVENNDYDAFVAATEGTPMADIDADTFAKMVEAHNLREAGDHEGARALMEELGIKHMKGHKGHRFMKHKDTTE